MTIRGTSNQSIKTMVKTTVSQSIEMCVAKNLVDGGGAGFAQVGAGEYRESDNAAPGYTFTPSDHHLMLGTPQVDYSAV